MGGERNRTRERERERELKLQLHPSSRSVAFLAGRSCVLPQTRPGLLFPWAFLGFRPLPHLTSPPMGQVRGALPVTRRPRQEREREREAACGQAQETSPTSSPSAFISSTTRYCRLLPRSYLLLLPPCSAFSSSVPSPSPRLSSLAARFLGY